MNKSAISWTTVTWNPVHGCSKISEGCRHCYAETLSLKRGWTTSAWTAPNAAQNIKLQRHKLLEPLKLKEASRIFVNSMSDLFHPLVPDSYIAEIFDVMARCPQHTFQVLTKRPERAAAWGYGWQPHIWMGTSVEDMRVASRIDHLRRCGAHVRFISAEPLIGPLANVDLTGIHWLIVGGESGDGFRVMPHSWARMLRDQCVKQGTAFFFKQSAAWRTEMGTALRESDGRYAVWHQFPQRLSEPVPASGHNYHYDFLLSSASVAFAQRASVKA